MDAADVRPKDWLWDENYPVKVLFDDGEYSAIWGKYQDQPALGVRWNGGTDRGYPGQGGHPTWYVEPDFIAVTILHRLFTSAIETGNSDHMENIQIAIRELRSKMTAANQKTSI